MDELVNLVAEKTGMSEEKARVAVRTVVDYMKEHLPAPIAGQIDTVLEKPDTASDLKKGLGGILGKG
ncbi:MAG: hypothetical protein R3272_00180 [Candidatus Promineifilaceae bacterium]|nr:hypothetical protein [Candidatus Promineifilaceae bacterium]